MRASHLVLDAAERAPDRPALEYGDHALSFGELANAALREQLREREA